MAGIEFEIRALGSWPPARPARPAGRVALWLFAAFCLLYLGTARGVLDTVDDVAMLRVTQALLTTGSVAVAPDTPGALQGQDGRWYTRYGIGQSLLAVPFYLVASRFADEPPRLAPFDPHGSVMTGPLPFAVTLIGLLCGAASVALLYLTCRALEIGHLGSLLAALALGSGTFAWHYSRTFMSEPPSMLALSLALYALVRFAREGQARWALVGGLAAAVLLLLRIGNATLLPGLGVYALWITLQRRAVLGLVAWLAPLLTVGAFLAAFNVARFGTPLETGYADQAQAFTTPMFVGVYGLLLSSGKGVLLYAPIVLAGVIGWTEVLRRQPVIASVLALIVASYVGFYARFEWWYGGGPWGPRFLTVVLPLLCLGIGALISPRLSRGAWLALVLLAAASLGVQVLSLAVPYLPYEARMVQDPLAYERMLFSPDASPILVHWRSLVRGEYPLDVALTYYPWPWLVWLQPAALAAGAGLLAVGARSDWRLPRRRRVPMSEAMPA